MPQYRLNPEPGNVGSGHRTEHTPTAAFAFKKFSAHLRQLVKWKTMMLQVQAKARVPQRGPPFSAGSSDVQLL